MGGCCTRIAELRQDAKLKMLALDTGGRLCQPVAGGARDWELSYDLSARSRLIWALTDRSR